MKISVELDENDRLMLIHDIASQIILYPWRGTISQEDEIKKALQKTAHDYALEYMGKEIKNVREEIIEEVVKADSKEICRKGVQRLMKEMKGKGETA